MVIAIEISAGEYGSEWINRMINAVAQFPTVAVSRSTSFELELEKKIAKVSWLEQFLVLSRRMLLQLFRNKVKYLQ